MTRTARNYGILAQNRPNITVLPTAPRPVAGPVDPLPEIEMMPGAAAFRKLGISPATGSRWCQSGKLAGAVQYGDGHNASWYVPVASVRAVVEAAQQRGRE